MNDIHLGIDIGSTKVAVVLAQSKKNNTLLEIIGAGKVKNEGVLKGTINNPLKTKDAIKQALDIAIQKSGMPDLHNISLNATVNVGGVHLEHTPGSDSIVCRSAEVSSEDMVALLENMQQSFDSETNQIIHLLPLKFAVGDQRDIDDPVGHTGLKLSGEFNVISAKKSALQQIRDSLQKANVQLGEDEGFAASPLVAGLAILTDAHKQLGVVLVDIGGGTTDIAIYQDGLLRHTAVLPFGGNHITQDIREGCDLPFDSAEEAKTMISETDPNACSLNQLLVVPIADGIPPIEIVARNIVLIARARLREIAALVLAEIRKAGFAENKLRAGIVLTGGTASISGLDHVFKEVTGMHVHVGMPKNLERTNAPLHDVVVGDPAYTTALGLAWAGIKPLDKRVLKPRKSEQPQKKTGGGGFFNFGFKDLSNIKDVRTYIWNGLTKDDIQGQDKY